MTYRTFKRISIRDTAFPLVFRAEAMDTIEVVVPSACIALANEVFNDRIYDVKTLKEKGTNYRREVILS